MATLVVGDWGTSRLRLFRVEDGEVTGRAEGPGIAALDDTPEAVLRKALADWRAAGESASIRLGGMVGSRNGWIETGYVDCPADLATWRAGAATLALDGVPVAIMPGLAADEAGIADVMRGEETQIFGALSLRPELARGAHTIVLPGTHSKWVRVADGRILGFRTFFTGELFALLRDRSTLARAAIGHEAAPEDGGAGFDEGLARVRDGVGPIGGLFAARAMQLRAGRSHGWALGYMSGLLIGGEIAEASAAYPGAVTLVGAPALTELYARAFGTCGVAAAALDGDACAIAGLLLAEEEA